jgi:hypothetical protein
VIDPIGPFWSPAASGSKLDAPIPPEALAEITADLFSGRRVDAIKRCQECTGMRISEAVYRINAVEHRLRATNTRQFKGDADNSKGDADHLK